MSAEDLSPPLAKQGMVDSNCEINKLADADLAAIFKRLPPYDRLLVSEVCKRWHAISSISWLDVTKLDLSPIPVDSIAAIVKRCPNLRIVSAVRQTLGPRELCLLSRLNLFALKLYDCSADVGAGDNNYAVFPRDLADAAWEELVLHDFLTGSSSAGVRHAPLPDALPAVLRRLHISSTVESYVGRSSDLHLFSRALLQSRSLECLLLYEIQLCGVFQSSNCLTSGALRNLRELCLACAFGPYLWRGLMKLPNLQALFLHHCFSSADDDFDKLVTKHPSLRIVAFTGILAHDMEFPMRVRYANGYGSEPLPLLHVLVGGIASARIRIPKFPSDAAKVYPISEHLPQFLAREDIAPIFEGVWIAKKIKEADKNGAVLHGYEDHIATSLRSVDM